MKKQDFSKKIIKILAEKPAVSVADIAHKIHPSDQKATSPSQREEKTASYAITRSLKGLRDAGLIESHSSGQKDYARLTKEGKKKAHSLKLEGDNVILNPQWDGKWRIILLDLPESRKAERESLRYLLKKAGFVCLKNSAWISPYPFEHLFTNIKNDLGLVTEVMIIVTDKLDETTQNFLLENFKI